MTDIKVYGELLASEDNRVLRYRLLPFGSIGRTNVGAVLASENSVFVPEDISHLTLNTEHNQMTPVGRFVSVTKGEDALYASVSISKFPRGDDALALTASGELTGISVEVANAVIQDGKLTGGELIGAALCKTPAFPEAVLMASNTGDIQEALSNVQTALDSLSEALETPSEAPAEEEIETPEETPTDSSEEEEELIKKGLTAMENSAIPTVASDGGTPEIKTFEQGVALIAAAAKDDNKVLVNALNSTGVAGSNNLFAALANVTDTAGTASRQDQWLGEAWLQKAYVRKYAPLLTNAPLTARTMRGWRFVQGPIVDDYLGFPNQVPTREVTIEEYTAVAARLAGGNSIDRIYKDFGDTEFLNGYYRFQIEEYARKSDQKALLQITSSATAVAPGTVPTGLAAAAVHIVDGALSIIADDLGTPTAALVPTAMYRELMLTREDTGLKYLESSAGLEVGSVGGFQIIPSNDVTAVHVISRPAATFYELPGTPVRAEVETPANGGFDTAIFGYYAAVTHDSRGIVRVETPPVTP